MAAISARSLKLLCWRLVLLVLSFLSFCISVLTQLKFCLFSPPTLKKLPRHLALLVDSEDAIPHLSKLLLLLKQLGHLGLQHISVYDPEGALKLVLADALKENSGMEVYSHYPAYPGFQNQSVNEESSSKQVVSGGKQDADKVIPCEEKSHLKVEVLCIKDGKQAIVKAARNICLKALHQSALLSLREEDLDRSLKETGGSGPDPDLLLLCSNARCLQGFPPWRLRLTEIQHIGSIKGVSDRVILRALEEFSHKHHRYGK